MSDTSRLRRVLKSTLKDKQNRITGDDGLLGDGNGLVATGDPNMVYVRAAGGVVARVYNDRVPLLHDLPVKIGFDPLHPSRLRVLDISEAPVSGQEGETFINVGDHGSNHRVPLGRDPVWVELRQFMPLRLSPIPNTLTVHLYPGAVKLPSGAYQEIAGAVYDLTSYVPATSGKARFTLVSISDAGAVTFTAGAEVDIAALDATTVPAAPAGTAFELGMVRTYYGQTEIIEAANDTDIWDLRFPMPHTHGAGSTLYNDAEGDPVSVDATGAADGTSDYAARRDHRHQLGTHDHSGDAGDGGAFPLANLSSGAASVGQVLTADGAGGAAWGDQASGDARRYLGVYNYYIGAAGAGYSAGLAGSPDGRTWTPIAAPFIPKGAAGTWDDYTHQFPSILEVDGVLWSFYSGKPDSTWANFAIGVARSFDGGTTWEKYASNPVLSAAGWEGTTLLNPVVFYDREEADGNKRWKMWYGASSFGEGIGYATSPDGLTWTKFASNPVVPLGGSGAWDDTCMFPGAVIRRKNDFVLFYGGNHGGTWQAGYVTFTDPEGTYTKSADNPILQSDGITSALTANLTLGSTAAAVADATLFPIGCPVWVYDGTNKYLTRVTARTSATALTLADAAPVQINSGGAVRSAAYNSVDLHAVRYEGDRYLFSITAHQADPAETGVHELALYGYAGDDLSRVYIDYDAGVQLPVTVTESRNANVSRENLFTIDTWDEPGSRTPPIGTDADEKAKVSANDTTAGYLNGKLTAGTGITFTEGSDGGNETLEISVTGGVPGAAVYPTRATLWHDESRVTAGNALAHSIDTAHRYNSYSFQNPEADGDTFTQSFMLAAGTYTLGALGCASTNRGKIDWYIDDVLAVSGQDWYGASPARNTVKTAASLTVTGSGRHVLKGVINGKNASSSSYVMALTKMWFIPASDGTSV